MKSLFKGVTKNRAFVILCVVGAFAILSSTLSKNPVLKPFADSLGIPEHLLGFVAAASTIPGILFSLPAGTLSDIVGRRKILLMSSFVFASAPFLYLLITSWRQLVLVRFYHGFATAIFIPVVNASIAERFPRKRGERISFFSSATIVGRTVAPFLGGFILAITDYGYHTLYLTVAVAGILAFMTAVLFLDGGKHYGAKTKNPAQTIPGIFNGWRKVAKNSGIAITSVIEGTQYYAFGAVEFFLVGYLKEVVRLDAFLIGIILGGQLAVTALARPFMGRLSDKIGRRLPIVLGSILSGFPLAVIPFTTQFPILLLVSIMYGIGFSLVTSSTPPLVSDLVEKDHLGTAMGFLSTIMDVGQALGPIIAGFVLATTLTYYGVFTSLTVILLTSCFIFIISKTGVPDQQ
ncbi:MAG: MFS transporter [Candidatus Bathyarchaeota archaeon]|nr:MAG: MFS transporter [Candidatus Bathyarchaeota archaeon]